MLKPLFTRPLEGMMDATANVLVLMLFLSGVYSLLGMLTALIGGVIGLSPSTPGRRRGSMAVAITEDRRHRARRRLGAETTLVAASRRIGYAEDLG